MIPLIMLAGTLLGSVAFAQQPAGPPVLSLADAVRIALQSGLLASDAANAVSAAEAQVTLVRGRLAPRPGVDALGSFGQSTLANQNYGFGFSQDLLTGTRLRANANASSAQNQLGTFYTGTTSFSVTQPLWRGFGGAAIRRDIETAEIGLDSARSQEHLTRQQVTLAVASTYYQIAAQMALIDVAEQSLRNARGLLEASEAMLSLGRVSRLDVLRASQLVVQSELQVMDARASVDDARGQLRLLMGRDETFEFEIDGRIPDSGDEMPLDRAVALARETRQDIAVARASLLLSQRQLDATVDASRPQVDLTLEWRQMGTGESLRSAFRQNPFRLGTFAGISLPFDRTATNVARQTSLRQVHQQERRLALLRLQADHEVRTSHRALIRLARVVEQAEIGQAFAEQEVELARLRYQRGLSNNLDIVNAEGNVLSAAARLYGARAELAMARLRYRATIGSVDLLVGF